MEGNQFSYLSPRLVTNLVKMSDSIPPEHKEMVKFAIKELIPESNFIVSVTSRTKDGILVSTNSSLDGATSTISQIGVAPLAIVAGMTLPALSKAREKARRANCASNMKQLGLALLMHAAENDGRFPDSLDKLAEQNLLNASKVYRCPSSLNADDAPADANDIRQGKTDYVYCGQGVKDDDDDATNVIILYEKDDNHPGGQWMNFLFVDGHVEGFAVNGGGIQEALKQNPKWKLGRPAKKNQ